MKIVAARCGPLQVIVDRCRSLWVVPHFSMYGVQDAFHGFSACSPTLFLPRGKEDPEELIEMMKQVLSNCHGFGKV